MLNLIDLTDKGQFSELDPLSPLGELHVALANLGRPSGRGLAPALRHTCRGARIMLRMVANPTRGLTVHC